jgi:hypothetical protein
LMFLSCLYRATSSMWLRRLLMRENKTELSLCSAFTKYGAELKNSVRNREQAMKRRFFCMYEETN